MEDIEDIDMEPSTNPEGEPGTQVEGTRDEMSNIPTVQGTSSNAEPSDTVEALELTTSLNTSGDEPGSSQATEHQEIQA
ncbi:hypothetical protein HAX54_016816, partial [Datura stramonium]|nr:hypothetical protein [Datura stramonium]